MFQTNEIVLLLGSAPSVTECRAWRRAPFDRIVAINNAWRVRPDWDVLILPEDFPGDRRPQRWCAGQRVVTAHDFVPVQNAYGGFVYAGGTMAFTAGYWALGALRPRVLAFLGCDMVYPAQGRTHFYGNGTADPLRPDPTLQSLEAKSARLQYFAAEQGCACVNLSTESSRLVFPRVTPAELSRRLPAAATVDAVAAAQARAMEAALGYFVESGRYWEEADRFDAASLARLDALWLATAGDRRARTGATAGAA